MLLSGSARSFLTARISAILLAFASSLVLPSCWVSSINGLSEAELFETDKDQAYDPALLGAWTTKSGDCETTLTITANGKDYHWQTSGVGEGCDKDRGDAIYYEAQLFKLDDHKLLDVTARSSDVCDACVAVHWIFKVDVEKDSFSLIPIDSDWLDKAEKEKTVILATVHGNHDLLRLPAYRVDILRTRVVEQ